jgi:hypothetical protein
MADAPDSKSGRGNPVGVQVPPPAPTTSSRLLLLKSFLNHSSIMRTRKENESPRIRPANRRPFHQRVEDSGPIHESGEIDFLLSKVPI